MSVFSRAQKSRAPVDQGVNGSTSGRHTKKSREVNALLGTSVERQDHGVRNLCAIDVY